MDNYHCCLSKQVSDSYYECVVVQEKRLKNVWVRNITFLSDFRHPGLVSRTFN